MYMKVHLTSITVFDLLYSIEPELQSQESLNLKSYIDEYEAYFNEHIDLEINGESKSLRYDASNLIVHDSWINFEIMDHKSELENYSITVEGFDFYKNPNFTVILTTKKVNEFCSLSRSENSCAGGNLPLSSYRKAGNRLFLLIPMALAFLTIVIIRNGRFWVLVDNGG